MFDVGIVSVPIVVIVAVLAGWAIMRFVAGPSAARTVAGLVLYLALSLPLWGWVSWLFWAALVVAVLAVIYCRWQFYEDSPRDQRIRLAAIIASWLVLGIPVLALVIDLIFRLEDWLGWSSGTWFLVFAVTGVVLGLLWMWLKATVLLWVAGLLIALAAIFGIAWFVVGNTSADSSSPDTGAPPTTEQGMTPDQQVAQQQAQAALYVDYSQVGTDMCNTLVQQHFGDAALVDVTDDKGTSKTPKFVVGAENSVVGSAPQFDGETQRLWSDAVNVPLDAANQTLEGVQATICHDPAQAAMVMNGMGPAAIGSVTVIGQNPWMQAQGDSSAINQWAQGCLTDDVATHLACAKTMAAVATLVGRFQGSVGNYDTVWNYHLSDGGTTVGTIPPFGLNPTQESNAPFVVIDMTEKTGGCFLRFGFNIGPSADNVNGGDQRLAALPCAPPQAPPAETPAPPAAESSSEAPPPAAPTTEAPPPAGTTSEAPPPGTTEAPPPPSTTSEQPPPTTEQPPPTTEAPPPTTEQPPPTTEQPPPTTEQPPPTTSCNVCLSKPQVSQDPLPPPAQTQSVPQQAPSAQPTKPVDTSAPPAPTHGGYDGGSTSQPGTTAPPATPLPPSQTAGGDPGGF